MNVVGSLAVLGLGGLDHVFWAVVAYVCVVQIHNGLIHVGNALMTVAKVNAANKEKA